MSTVKFVPKQGKPHIRLIQYARNEFHCPFFGLCCINNNSDYYVWNYVYTVNPDHYKTPGEAARALFNYRGDL